MYAGASGDFNQIHWNERFAKTVGLPDVIAHGMFTMAAGRPVRHRLGRRSGAVVDYGVRFSSMVVVPDDDQGATITVSGVVEEKLADRRVVVGADGSGGRRRGAVQGARGGAARLMIGRAALGYP